MIRFVKLVCIDNSSPCFIKHLLGYMTVLYLCQTVTNFQNFATVDSKNGLKIIISVSVTLIRCC